MDNLSVSDEYYDKKYKDMQVRLDKLYDEIDEFQILLHYILYKGMFVFQKEM